MRALASSARPALPPGLSSHPNVATIYDVGEHDGRAFIVMELMRGGSVADVLRKDERIEHQRALRWLREAASGLDAAHAAGIVHRDVKPANLLLDERDRLGIGDFGIARLAWEEQVTQTGQVLGTAAYISPEQAMGEAATAASDRYSLAVVAFELLTGEKPFQAEHFAAQARAQIEDDPPRVSELDPGALRARRRRDRPRHGQGPRRPLGDRRGVRRAARRVAHAAAAPQGRAGHDRDTPAGSRDRTPPPSRPARPAAAAERPGSSGPGTGVLLAALAAALLVVVLGFLLLKGNGDDKGNQASKTSTPTATAKKKETPSPTPTATKTQTPEPTADGDEDAEAEAAPPAPAAGGQREPAPGPGVQPQQRRQVRRGAAGRPAGGHEGLQGRRARSARAATRCTSSGGPSSAPATPRAPSRRSTSGSSATPTTSARPSRSC